MITPNDTSIVTAICHYPDISPEERERLFSRLQDSNLKNVCLAAIGELDTDNLQEPYRSFAEQLAGDCTSRIIRIRDQQWKARRENVMTPFAEKLTKLHRQGKVPEQMLILYGISGTIPYRHTVENRSLTRDEKIDILQRRMERRFGVSWRERFHELPEWLGGESFSTNWIEEGF